MTINNLKHQVQQSINDLDYFASTGHEIGYAGTATSIYTSYTSIEQRLDRIENMLEKLIKERIAMEKLKS